MNEAVIYLAVEWKRLQEKC